MTNKERRFGEIRAADDGAKLRGYAAVFDSPTMIGGWFQEVVAPGAFAESVADDDIRALFDHDAAMVLGRNEAGTLDLKEDERGLYIEIDLPDTQVANDLRKSVERGDISQMSFGFQTLQDSWDHETEPETRTLEKVKLFEVSVVTFPAYEDTEVALRSLEDSRKLIAPNVDIHQRRRRLSLTERVAP